MSGGNSAHEKQMVTNVEVVAWSLATLGGAEREVHLEEIALKAFSLKPGAFRWDLDEYAAYIDKDKVRVSLTDAAKLSYGRLTRAVGKKIQGESKPTDWWTLTPEGTKWCSEQAERLAAMFGEAPPSLKRGVAKRLRDQIVGSELYLAFSAARSIDQSIFALADLLECSPDASDAVFRERFEALYSKALLLADSDVMAFLDSLSLAFAPILRGEQRD